MKPGDFRWSNNPIRLYRDTRKARIAGVCAGIAAYLDIKVKFVRIGYIIGLVWAFPVFLTAYIALAVLLKPMPQQLFKSPSEEQFWRTVNKAPNLSVGELKNRFRALDRRLVEMEARVTSDEFDLRQKFRDLKA